MTSEDKDLTIRILLDKHLCSPILAAESYLKHEQYDNAIDNLTDYIGKEKYKSSGVYFLVEYYFGQAIFRKEFTKKLRENNRDRKLKRFRKVIVHLENSIALQPDFIDAKILLGLVCVVMARLTEWYKYQQKAKILFEECSNKGNDTQKEFAMKNLDFL